MSSEGAAPAIWAVWPDAEQADVQALPAAVVVAVVVAAAVPADVQQRGPPAQADAAAPLGAPVVEVALVLGSKGCSVLGHAAALRCEAVAQAGCAQRYSDAPAAYYVRAESAVQPARSQADEEHGAPRVRSQAEARSPGLAAAADWAAVAAEHSAAPVPVAYFALDAEHSALAPAARFAVDGERSPAFVPADSSQAVEEHSAGRAPPAAAASP